MSSLAGARPCSASSLSTNNMKRPIDVTIRCFLARTGHSEALCKYMVEGQPSTRRACATFFSTKIAPRSDPILAPSAVISPRNYWDVMIPFQRDTSPKKGRRGSESSTFEIVRFSSKIGQNLLRRSGCQAAAQ